MYNGKYNTVVCYIFFALLQEREECVTVSIIQSCVIYSSRSYKSAKHAWRSCTSAAYGWAFVHERCVWFARGKPVMGRPRGNPVPRKSSKVVRRGLKITIPDFCGAW